MKSFDSISPFYTENFVTINSDWLRKGEIWKKLTSVICVVSCIPAVASWHDSDRVRRLPAAVAVVAVAAAAVAAVAAVAETVACTAPLSEPCWKTTTQSISEVL
jgi:hypothetical protein